MRYEKRTSKNGTSYFSFITSNRKRFTKEEIRNRFGKDILTEEEAKECLKLLETKFELTKMRIQKRITWEKEYYSFSKLLEQYLVKQKKSAPNSWQNSEFYLKHYVLYYFLQVKKLNNIELWVDNYSSFMTWLETAKTVKSNRPIAVASRNHAIKALNTFMEHLYKDKVIASYSKCETFGQHLVNERSIDDVIHEHEMEKVYKRLLTEGHKAEAVYFRYLYFSGMRFNEGLCISLADLFQGELDNELIKKKLKSYGLNYHGYIVSDGQFGGLDQASKVIRLPFKGKKKVDEKFNRIVPIVDRVLWNDLVDIAAEKHERWPEGRDKKDCLLFAGIDDSTATRRLQAAFDAEKLKWRSWHCLRHSRATWLIGETGDVMLARLWLGHTSPRTIEKYNHMYQAITRAAKSKETVGKTFKLKKV